MFEVLVAAILAIPAAYATALEISKKPTWEEHIKAGIAISLITALLSFISAIESMAFGTATTSVQSLIPIPAGLEILTPIFAFISGVLSYLIAVVIVKAVEEVRVKL